MQTVRVGRGLQRYAALWSLGLLLQQFHIVILLQLPEKNNQLRKEPEEEVTTYPEEASGDNILDASGRPDDLVHWNSSECSTQGLHNLTLTVTLVLQAQYNDSVDRILEWMPSCNSSIEEHLQHFWQSQALFKPLYPILSALLYSVSGCPAQVERQLGAAEVELGCEMAEEALMFLLEVLDDTDTKKPDDTDMYNTNQGGCHPTAAEVLDDPNEQDVLEVKMEIINKNLLNLGELASLMEPYLEATEESEREQLRDIILDHITSMKETLTEEQEWAESNMNCIRPADIDTNATLHLLKAMNISHIQHRGAILHPPQMPNASITQRPGQIEMLQPNKTQKRKRRNAPLSSHSPSRDNTTEEETERLIYRRQHQQIPATLFNSTSPLFFFKMVGGCKLLTSNGSGCLPEEYSDRLLEKQLWFWTDATTLQNKHTNISIPVEVIQCKSSNCNDNIPLGCTSGDGGHLWIPTKDCVVTFKYAFVNSHNLSNTKPLWQLVPFSLEEDHLQDLVCPFFFKTNSFPCQLLTESEGTVVHATALDLDYPETQLWYWSQGRLINFYSGLALEAVPEDANETSFYIIPAAPKDRKDKHYTHQLWHTNGENIRSTQRPDLNLDVIHNDLLNISVGRWSFLDALSTDNQITVTECVQLFFVKIDALPCQLLTAQDAELHMQSFNSSRVLNQLWFTQGGRLINMASGLALGFRAAVNTTSVRAELLALDDFPDTQKWDMDTLVSSKWDPDCLLCVEGTDHSIQVHCNHNMNTPFRRWEWIEFGTGFTSMEMIQCQYFIKSNHPACEVLTGFPETGAIQLRPVTEQLFHLQMWHWKGNHLIHTASGLYLSTPDNGKEKGDLTLEQFDPLLTQVWKWDDQNIMSALSNNSVVTLQRENGKISLQINNSNAFQEWEFVESSRSSNKDNFLNCPIQNSSTFFIINTLMPCLLLTGAPDGKSPQFRHYDSNAAQLWQWDFDHLVNVESGLALHLSHSRNPVMFEKLTFEKAQRWSLNKGVLRSTANLTYVLTPADLADQSPVLSCSQSEEPQWEVVGVEKVWEDPEDFVCIYFIQNQHSPCEVLTSFSANETIKARPVVDELIDSQLWYWNGGRLVHTQTGLSLGLVGGLGPEEDRAVTLVEVNIATENNTWAYDGGHITILNKSLTINADDDGTIKVSAPKLDATQVWKLLRKEEALKDPQLLHCEAQIPPTQYFIKNSAYPCKLLTAGAKGHSPHFQGFDTDIIHLQLWYKDGRHLVNVGTNLAIQLQPEESSSSSVILWDKYAFSLQQRWEDQGSILRSMEGTGCVLTMDSDHKASCAPHRGQSQQHWTLVQNNAGLEEIVCVYFIRNQHKSCEYLTGYSEGSPVLLRPVMDELLENQLWHWDGPRLTSVKTGLVLHQDVSAAANVILHRTDSGHNTTQLWTLHNSEIKPLSRNTVNLDVDTGNDGRIKVNLKSNGLTQQWVFLEMTEAQANTDMLFCTSLPNDPALFFLKNHARPCELLTASEGDKRVGFRGFNGKTLGLQLWFWHEGHLMNLGTGLALLQGEPAVLWPLATFSNRQRWTEERGQIRSQKQPTCALAITTDLGEATVTLSCSATTPSMEWQKVSFNEDMTNFDDIVCSYFIKNNLQPCDLLTGFNNGTPVKVSPLNPHLNQLWYWEGQHLVNKQTHLVLHTLTDDNTVRLSDKRQEGSRQEWLMNDGERQYIQSTGTELVLDLSSSTVALAFKADQQSQRWSLVPLELGLDNLDLLNCKTKRSNVEQYLLKSEQDPCHLLTQVEGDQLSLQEFSMDYVDGQLWFRESNHILSSLNHLALSSKTKLVTQSCPVTLETKFSYELYQMWQRDGQLLRSYLRDRTLVLVSQGKKVILQTANGQKAEKWTWLNLQDVKEDTKLVTRCSRCYDKGEEKAAEIIGYIPFISLYYNLVRSAVYAGKGCKKVALDSLLDVTIDVALDLGMALVTVATAGTATSVALGIKTGVKLGAKAGVKAINQALKATIKVGVHSLKTSFKAVLKQGIKQNTQHVLKNSLKSLKNTMKSIKHLSITTAKGVKKVSVKSYQVGQKVINRIKIVSQMGLKVPHKSLTKTSLKQATFKLGKSIKAKSKTLGVKLKAMGNELAAEAERKIKLLDEIEAKKGKTLRRCKREITPSCRMAKRKKNKKTSNAFNPKQKFENDERFLREKLNIDKKDLYEEIYNRYKTENNLFSILQKK